MPFRLNVFRELENVFDGDDAAEVDIREKIKLDGGAFCMHRSISRTLFTQLVFRAVHELWNDK